MTIIYTEVETSIGGKSIKADLGDNKLLWIPIDPANSDYQRYLRWLENPEAEEFAPRLAE
jgi:hypothetical protein